MKNDVVEIPNNGTWYTERAYKELKKEKRLLAIAVDNRDMAIRDLQDENLKLKDLLKRCRDFINYEVPDHCIDDVLIDKIDEALK